jgi:tetratricopeptide (TPR) repeat protein
VSKNNILYSVIGLFAGLVIGFMIANALDQSGRAGEVRTGAMESANDNSGRSGADDSSAAPSEEEVRGAIAKTDARADDIALQRNFGLALYQYSQQAQETRYLPDIARILKRAYEAAPKDHDLTVALASVFFEIGQSSDPAGFGEARNYYLKALEMKPDDASARARLGQTYYFAKPSDPQRAIVEYRKALTIDPRHEPSRGAEEDRRVAETEPVEPGSAEPPRATGAEQERRCAVSWESSLKYLIITGVVAIIFYALLYWRLRPYIATVRRILGIVRDMRRMSEPRESSPRAAGEAGQRLVRCDACGIWTPASRAIKLRSSTVSYCSHACLENAATGSARKRAGGRQ